MSGLSWGLLWGLWASCVGDGGCPLWLHGSHLVLATPIASDGLLYRYRLEKTLFGTPPPEPEFEYRPWGYGPYSIEARVMRPIVDGKPVVLAMPESKVSHSIRRGVDACQYDVFSWDRPGVKEFVEDRSREWQATLRIRSQVMYTGEALEKVQVVVEGEGAKRFLESDEKGLAWAQHLVPGRYRVTARKGQSVSRTEEVLLTPLGCGTLILELTAPTLVQGKVVDRRGAAVAGQRLWFEAVRPERLEARRESWPITTGKDGSFEIRSLPPEDYYLGANMKVVSREEESSLPTVFYPGVRERKDAELIRVREAQPVQGLVLRLPDFGGKRKLIVKVVNSEGQPLAGASVWAEADAQRNLLRWERPLQSDERGRVETTIWGEGRYRIRAIARDATWIEDLTPEQERTIEPGSGTVTLRVVKGRRSSPAGNRDR